MTVLLAKKKAPAPPPPTLTKREARELRRLHPQQPVKDQRKALKRRERLVRQLGKGSGVFCGVHHSEHLAEHRSREDKDGDVILDEEAYDFNEHFK